MGLRNHRLLIAAIAGVLLIAGLASACGGDNNESKTATRTPQASSSRSASQTPAASRTRTPGTSASAAAGAEIKMIPTLKFDKTALTIDANKAVTLTVNNTDTGVQHSFFLYKSKADADANKSEIASTKVCTGPCKDTVELNLTPGEYFFHCSVHPAQMTGTLTAK